MPANIAKQKQEEFKKKARSSRDMSIHNDIVSIVHDFNGIPGLVRFSDTSFFVTFTVNTRQQIADKVSFEHLVKQLGRYSDEVRFHYSYVSDFISIYIRYEQVPEKYVTAEQVPEKYVTAEQVPEKYVTVEQIEYDIHKFVNSLRENKLIS